MNGGPSIRNFKVDLEMVSLGFLLKYKMHVLVTHLLSFVIVHFHKNSVR